MLAVLMTLLVTAAGCGGLEDSDQEVNVDALATVLDAELGIPTEVSPEPQGLPVMDNILDSARSGSVGGESVLLLEFFDEDEVDAALGGRDSLGATRAFTSHNVVVLYTPAGRGPDRASEVAEILAEAPTSG